MNKRLMTPIGERRERKRGTRKKIGQSKQKQKGKSKTYIK